MKHLLLLLATYTALATQAAGATALAIGDCHPPLVWLPVVLALTWFPDARGVVWAAAIGLFVDGLSSGRFGVEMLAATLTAALMLPLRPDAEVRSQWPKLVWRFAVLATGLLLSRGLGSILSYGPTVTWNTLTTLAAEASYGLAFCLAASLIAASPRHHTPRYHHA